MNKVSLVGRLVRDPEVRYSQAETPVAVTRFTVAVNRRFKKEGEPDADFISCIAFGKTGEFVSKYFNKGKMIGLSGNIRTSSWTDNNNQKRYATDVVVEEVEFVESKASSEGNAQASSQPYNAPQNAQPQAPKSDEFFDVETSVDDDNLPF